MTTLKRRPARTPKLHFNLDWRIDGIMADIATPRTESESHTGAGGVTSLGQPRLHAVGGETRLFAAIESLSQIRREHGFDQCHIRCLPLASTA